MADELGKTTIPVVHDLNFASCTPIASSRCVTVMMPPDVLREVNDLDIPVHNINGHRIGV